MYTMKVLSYNYKKNHELRILLTVKQTISLLTKCFLEKKKVDTPKT